LTLERITVTMESELVEKIRLRQAQAIKNLKKSVSFSAVVQNLIEMGLKK